MANRSLTISNASFESVDLPDGDWNYSIAGWQVSGYGGTYDGDPTYIDVATIDGENVAWLYDDGTAISQTLSETYQDGATYSFDIALGDEDGANNASYELNIYAVSTLIGSTSGTTDENNQLSLYSVSSLGFSDPSLNGEPIRIEVVKTGGLELLVDHVRGYVEDAPDGVVDGEDTGELMELGYDDSQGDTNGGGDLITTGADNIVGGGGNDTIDGDEGDDTIFGDAGSETPDVERVFFDWSAIADPDNGGQIDDNDVINSGDQVVGNTTVTYSTVSNAVEFNDDRVHVRNIDAGDELPDRYSSASLEVSGTTQLAFSQAVENISFRINDLENNLETLVVRAYDEHGQPTSYSVSVGSQVSATDTDAVDGVDRFIGTDTASDTSASGSVLFTMAGPISRIEIDYVNNGGTLTVTNVYFDDAPDPLPEGNDQISGGAGADVIDGGGGDDTIAAGTEDDEIRLSTGSDQIDGGAGTDTYVAGTGTTGADEEITVTIDNTGAGTVAKTNDGSTDTLTSIERFIADEATGTTDVLTITEEIIDENISGLSDDAVGTFTPKDGGPVIAFGGVGQPTINQILSGTYDPGSGPVSAKGDYQIVSGEEDGAQLDTIYAENFEQLNFKVVCFVRGTLIDTLCGPKPIETLTEGSIVWTATNGYRPIRWIGSKRVPALGNRAPIRIAAHALENTRYLWVSPQHRMLLSGWKVELLFGQEHVLVPAKALVNGDSVRVVEQDSVEYYHMLFDGHEIVRANGALSESFHPGEQGMDSLSAAVREEILSLFPDLVGMNGSFGPTVFPALTVREGRVLAPDALLPGQALGGTPPRVTHR